MQNPVPCSPSVEHPARNEDEVNRGLNGALGEILEAASKDLGHAVHAKSHGLIEAELEVLPDLPPEGSSPAPASNPR